MSLRIAKKVRRIAVGVRAAGDRVIGIEAPAPALPLGDGKHSVGFAQRQVRTCWCRPGAIGPRQERQCPVIEVD